jgi:hypothetical protein
LLAGSVVRDPASSSSARNGPEMGLPEVSDDGFGDEHDDLDREERKQFLHVSFSLVGPPTRIVHD